MFDAEFIGPLGAFIIIGFIVKIILDYRIKRRLIDKGAIDENVKFLFHNKLEHYTPSSLKWGLILIGLGLAVVIGDMFPYDYDRGEITFSLMLLFAGVGLLIYYFIANKKMKEIKNSQQNKTPSPPQV